MTNNPLDKILQGMQETEVIKGPPPALMDDEKIKKFIDFSKQQTVFPPFSITRNARIKYKEEALKPNEPTS